MGLPAGRKATNTCWFTIATDIWKLDPAGEDQPECLTGGAGREHKMRYRVQRLDREARHIDLDEPVVLSAFDETTRDSGYCLWTDDQTSNDEDGDEEPTQPKDTDHAA